MNSQRVLLTAASALALVLLTGCASLAPREGDGYVAGVNAADLRVCFYEPDAAPGSGAVVQIVRVVKSGGQKTPARVHRHVIGSARVVAATADADPECRPARLITGKARRFDKVKLHWEADPAHGQ